MANALTAITVDTGLNPSSLSLANTTTTVKWIGRKLTQGIIVIGILLTIGAIAMACLSSDNYGRVGGALGALFFCAVVLALGINMPNAELETNIYHFSSKINALTTQIDRLKKTLSESKKETDDYRTSLERESVRAKRNEENLNKTLHESRLRDQEMRDLNDKRMVMENHLTDHCRITAEMNDIVQRMQSKSGLIDAQIERVEGMDRSLTMQREEIKKGMDTTNINAVNLSRDLKNIKNTLEMIYNNNIQIGTDFKELKKVLESTQDQTDRVLRIVNLEDQQADPLATELEKQNAQLVQLNKLEQELGHSSV